MSKPTLSERFRAWWTKHVVADAPAWADEP